jgi:hypothetical protein
LDYLDNMVTRFWEYRNTTFAGQGTISEAPVIEMPDVMYRLRTNVLRWLDNVAA